MAELTEGQRVRIVRGSYKKNGAGTYIEACGKVSCRVKVDGDNQQERTLRLSSIELFSPSFNAFRNNSFNAFRNNSNSTSDADDNKHKDEEESRRLVKKLLHELQAKVDELQRIIDNMN